MQRFCTDIPLGEYIHISTTDMYHQICHVLRAAVGDMYIFFRGDGSADQVYSITDISKKVIIMKHIRGEIANIEPQLHISLYQALPNKHEKIEYILQKGVEVGIGAFYFFRSDFSQKLAIPDNKKKRYIDIVREAVEQSHAHILPQIHYIESPIYSPIVDTTKNDVHTSKIYLHTVGPVHTIGDIDVSSGHIDLYIGPEGGWNQCEIDIMNQLGLISVHFSGNVLRTETAGVVSAFHFQQVYSRKI